ncbi:two-component system sensor histidine kinase BaeS [Edwardsiella piscicida]|uniref:envelope stress sensor histidine kinase BaeS n=1 Tax=Edwardsiella piscicida TaxID=1263550 RepID=UPI0010A6B303|nr:two-component system sensor histidine kinase BaeS [Edwardsiella piscicida]ELM3722475.1 two-component system sensor histidine kinase BaeS [Edwardsiella piscicida]ELM3728093.1 two-component system sensor histidine kinase BaeS [Edwardsiella piscicida]ELV7536303.1 two-component system sensor histidine kinase BaeS [Edwardsiella piscicida]
MRLGISAKLFLAILSTCILVLIIMHWGVRVSFERGFIDYIRHGNEQRVQLMASELETLYAREGNWDFLRHNERMIFRIMRDIEQSSNLHGSLPPHGWRTPFWVIDANGQRLVGPQGSLPSDGIRSAIRYQGRDVGWVLTTPPERLTRNTDINFDRQQRRTSWFIVALATLLAAAVTLLLSRGMLAPVKRLINAMHQLAAGNFATRVDVSSRDELGQLAQDFNQLATTLERNEQIRRALMADVSHELRTPLAVLRGELEALQDGVRRLTPDSLTSLQAEVSILTKLVNDLHQLSLSDAGALAYRKSPIEASALVQAAAGAFRDRLAAKGIRLTLRLPDEARVFGDPDRLLQLFNNLLENSLRYTDIGGELQIVGQKRSDTLTLCWQDSAPGVSEEQLQHIFERFYRAEGSRNRASGGSGLGLSICQNIVAAHGGSLRASHSPLGGVAMTVTLPLEEQT